MSEFTPVVLTLKTSPSTELSLHVLPYGVTVNKFIVTKDGKSNDIVIGPEDPKGHTTQKYCNSIVGRFSNRIPVGTHAIERKGIKGEVVAYVNEGDEVSLHGGPIGWDALPWTVTTSPQLFSEAEKAQIKALPEGSAAVFQLRSAAGDQGFPGTLDAEVLVALVPGSGETLGSAVIVYRAKLEEPNTVTPVNLTQHWGFNLDASLQDRPVTVLDHNLTIKADHIAELKPNSLATHKFIPVSEAPAHAHTGKKISENMPQRGYDDYYLLADSYSSAALSVAPSRVPLEQLPSIDLVKDILAPETNAEKTIVLSGPKSGLEIAFESNQRGAMFYSNAWGDAAKGARKKAHGGSGVPNAGDAYGPGTAAFIEYHHPIAAFLDPKNKDGEDTLLTSDELYHNYVRCEVRAKSA